MLNFKFYLVEIIADRCQKDARLHKTAVESFHVCDLELHVRFLLLLVFITYTLCVSLKLSRVQCVCFGGHLVLKARLYTPNV